MHNLIFAFVAPTHACCDNCDGVPVNLDDLDARPMTPETLSSNAGSPPTTPSKSADKNGKRKLTKPPAARRGALLESAQNALVRWCFQTKLDRYNPSSITAIFLLPDPIIKTLAPARHIQTVEALRVHTGWIFADRHGEEVLNVLRQIDQVDNETQEAEKQARSAERKAATAARQQERKQREREQRLERQRQKEVVRMQKQIEAQLGKEERAAQRAREKAEKQASNPRAGKRHKGSQRQPLEGCSTFNLEPTTPIAPQANAGIPTMDLSTPIGVLLDFQVHLQLLFYEYLYMILTNYTDSIIRINRINRQTPSAPMPMPTLFCSTRPRS
jgi:bloom syndrome protein